MMIKKVWLTTLTHFGSYDLTVVTENAEDGLIAINKEFNRAQKERGEFKSEYSFNELVTGGDVHQTELEINKVEWL